MLGVLVVLGLLPQGPDLQAVQHSEAARIATIARCAPAVCSVMDMKSPGGGSGVIIDPHGFVLTNFHVVGAPDPKYKLPDPPAPPAAELDAWKSKHPDADEAAQKQWVEDWQADWREEHQPKGKVQYRNKKVGLPDGQLYEAEVLGVDPGSDLGLLRLLPKEPGQTWPFATLGDSDQLLEGETVMAMGNPFLLATDFTPTVTFGIVSGTHRYQEGQGNRMLVYPDCIQVDAPVNPGNSGGPLFNEAGEVVGINGRISIGDRGRVNVGVGFAIASNQIKNFLGDLLAGRHAEHGTLDMSAWYMAAPGEERRRGVFVQQTFKDSVVALAGVNLGDEITHFNGTEVRTANQLATLIGVLPAGTWVTVGYRPALGQGGYGEERTVLVRMVALDTGSSTDAKADSERLASRADRRLAAQALLQSWHLPPPSPAPVVASVCRSRANGVTRRLLRGGDSLRIDLGDRALVRRSADEGFAIVDGKAVSLTAEEEALLDRELRANPFLWPGHLAEQLQGAMLLGGVMVDGIPAYRFAVAGGGGDLEAWYFAGGIPAGYALRDPVQKARLQVHLRRQLDDPSLPGRFHQPTHLRVIADGVCEVDWQLGEPVQWQDEAALDALFRRPQ